MPKVSQCQCLLFNIHQQCFFFFFKTNIVSEWMFVVFWVHLLFSVVSHLFNEAYLWMRKE